MTDQPATSQTRDCNAHPIKVQLWIRSRLLREELVRLFGKAKDLAVVSGTEESEPVDRLSNEPSFQLRIADTFEAAHMSRHARTSDAPGESFKVVLIGMSDSPEQFLCAIRAGVAGYLRNDASAADILAAARAPFRGEAFCAPRLCLTLFNYIAHTRVYRSHLSSLRFRISRCAKRGLSVWLPETSQIKKSPARSTFRSTPFGTTFTES